MTIASLALRRYVLVPSLIVVAIGLWLSTAPAGHAGTATQTQSLQATVTPSISWGSGLICVQDIGPVDFGTVAAGSFVASGYSNGCVSASIAPWSVSAAETADMTDVAGDTIPGSAVSVDTPTLAHNPELLTPDCSAPCPLDTPETLFHVDATSSAPWQFQFRYFLHLPSDQPSGSYTNGEVTLTASN
jgi:hypothetical protein